VRSRGQGCDAIADCKASVAIDSGYISSTSEIIYIYITCCQFFYCGGIKLPLCVFNYATKHYAVKMYGGGGMAP
jgi:hypothetical protein